jgi:hypothetical protein
VFGRIVRHSATWIIAGIIGIVVIGGVWWSQQQASNLIYVAPSATPVPTDTPDPTSSATLVSPTPRPTTTIVPPKPAASVPVAMKDPTGSPRQVTLYQGKTVLFTMDLRAGVRQSNGNFVSDCGKTAWYAEAGWPKPGALSNQLSLVTGHAWCRDEVYGIDRLQQSHKGALLAIKYSSGDIVVAKAIEDAKQVQKNQLNKLDEYLYNRMSARTIRLSTCDRDGGFRSDGRTSYNVAPRFVRVK